MTDARHASSPSHVASGAPTVALYGGSFNPPHLAHALAAAWTLAMGEADEVWVIPTGGHPFGKPLAPFDDRMEMCRLTFGFSEKIRVLDDEREPRVHYTIDTIRRLAAAHPGRRWRWLIGSDALADAPKWKDFDEIVRLAPPLVVPRQGHLENARGGDGASRRDAGDLPALPDVSSSAIRERLAAGEPIEPSSLPLPRAVLDYIKEKGLYAPTPAL